MKKFKRIKDAIVAIAFSDETYQAYSGAISEIEIYREDEDVCQFPASVNTEVIIKLRFPQGFTSSQDDGSPNNLLPEANIEGD